MHRPTLRMLALALTVGCSAAHATPDDVGSGVYELTVVAGDDACAARSTGASTPARAPMGRVGIVALDDVLNVGVPDASGAGLARVSLARVDGFRTTAEGELTACAGARLRREWQVVSSSDAGFDVVATETWTGLDACAVGADLAVPPSDCAAEQLLEYRLAEPCDAPCEVRLVAGDARCACD